jgi:glycosyltransferase involved in cell wall biosynthesis
MDHPALSIIIPVLNEEKYLPSLLTDLSLQTYRDFEVIIVDGQSQDKTVAKANQFTHRLPRLSILFSDLRNVCHQRNLGAQMATANLLLFMDADNRLPTFFLQGLKYRLDLTNPDIFSTWIGAEDDSTNSNALATVINLYLDIQKNTTNPFTIEGMLGFKKDLFHKLKGFNPNLVVAEGNDIVKKGIKKGHRFEIYKDPTYIFSLRRLRKQGTLKTLGSIAQLELSRLLGTPLNKKNAARLYPMKGGDFFNQEQINQPIFNSLVNSLKLQKQKDKLINFARSLLFVNED